MSIRLAIVIVAIWFLIDKHALWKPVLKWTIRLFLASVVIIGLCWGGVALYNEHRDHVAAAHQRGAESKVEVVDLEGMVPIWVCREETQWRCIRYTEWKEKVMRDCIAKYSVKSNDPKEYCESLAIEALADRLRKQ